MTRLVQLHRGSTRRVALVDEPRLHFLTGVDSVHALAHAALASGQTLAATAQKHLSGDSTDYDPIYLGQSDWHLLPPLDHPAEPARCIVTGTGLTHLGSAKDRQAMHTAPKEDLTDSMRMFRLGVESGKPAPGAIGAAPEWFYKGTGAMLRAHGEPLLVPTYAEDGGEEAEVAGLYLIAPDGQPVRLGFAIGNEFSDHRFERKNYLNLAGSKLRTCAIGPEMILDAGFQSVPGEVTLERAGQPLWSKVICTGQAEMCHSLENIEHHHFKFELHRRPGDVHVHFFGAHSLSFGDKVQLAGGDLMRIAFENFGRPLCNTVKVAPPPDHLVAVKSL